MLIKTQWLFRHLCQAFREKITPAAAKGAQYGPNSTRQAGLLVPSRPQSSCEASPFSTEPVTMRLLVVFTALSLLLDSVLGGISCPSVCTDSGSTRCRSIGCAYCGRSCDRRLLAELEATGGGSNGGSANRDLQQGLGAVAACVPLADKLEIEAAMDIDVSKYCNGAPGCSIVVRAEPMVV